MCVLVAEHRVAALGTVADEVLRITDGVVEASTLPVATQESSDLAPRARDGHADGPIVLEAHGVTVAHGGRVAVDAAHLDLRAGEIVALVGPNGAGKSSLLAAIALPGRDAQVWAAGRVALVPDASDDLFVYDTVAAECARADRRAARGRRGERGARLGEPTAARFAGFLGLDVNGLEFAARLGRHPRDLSAGERRCLALAIQLAGAPAVLMVDEPTRGLDPRARATVWAALASLAATGTAVLVASHEPEATTRADRTLTMRGGRLTHDADSLFTIQEERAAACGAPRNSGGFESGAVNHPELGTPVGSSASRPTLGRRRVALPFLALAVANVVAFAAFCWPFVAAALPSQAQAAVPVVALALAPLAALVVVACLDGTVRSAHLLALLGTLAAIGAAVRIASTGVGGVEAVFILLILAGRAFGARFGLLLGMATIALSTLITGTFGPWTPFQMFACAWVGAGAALLPRTLGRRAEIATLCVYGVVASYAFGLLMNVWFWPFAVGYGTGISYEPDAPLGTNLASFLLYSLVTSTLSWDTLRAITTVVGLVAVGRPVLAALRRTKPLVAARPLPTGALDRRGQPPMRNVPISVTPSDSNTGMSQPPG
jgi:energy-coupling factor transport system ATP-binding protein